MIRKPTLNSLSRSRYFLFLSALVLLLIGGSLLDDSPVHAAYFIVLHALVLAAAVRIVSEGPRRWIIALALAVLWLALTLWAINFDHPGILIAAHLLFILFNVYVLGVVLGSVISAVEVDFDILLGAAAVYLLIGVVWAFSYVVIHELDPKAFSLVHDDSRADLHQFLYFSLTTLTTLGYGDITPVSPFAQVWSTLEAVVGTLYMALLVARLVGMYQSQHPKV